MVSIANDSLHHLAVEIDEKPIEIKDEIKNEFPVEDFNPIPNSYQFMKTEEPLIEVNEESGGPDPLHINEFLAPANNRPVQNGVKRRRNYRKKAPKSKNVVVKITPKLPLEDLVIEAIEADGSPNGIRPDAIKRFLFSRYGMDLKIPEITKALQVGLGKGVISYRKRAKQKKLNGRYVLSKFYPPEANQGVRKVKGWRNALKHKRLRLEKEKLAADVENSNVSVVQDNSTESITDSKTIELDGPLVNGESANALDSESIGLDQDNPVHRDGIDFMVLHAVYSSANASGIRLYEIGEFIENFYDIDTQRSLPHIERYLKYSVEQGVLVQKGEKYRKADAQLKSNSKKFTSEQVESGGVSWSMDESTQFGNEVENNKSGDAFLCVDVKLEAEEISGLSTKSELVSDCEKIEIDGNNSLIPLIDEEQEAAEGKVQKRKIISSTNNIRFSKRMRNKVIPGHAAEQRDIELDNTNVALAKYIEAAEQHIKLEETGTTEEPFSSFMRRKVLPFSFENIRERIRRSVRKLKPMGRLAAFSKRMSALHYTFTEPIYTLDEITQYISRYPKIILDDPIAVMWDLSWGEIALTNHSPCLKLTGISIISDENINCKICGFELKFGTFNCDVCFFEIENIPEKCNICGLFCNRTDVFNKHFLWEHRPFIRETDDIPVSLYEEKIEKLLKNLVYDDSFHCGICRYRTNSTEVFENHMICRHTAKMNVLPELPEESVSDEVVIFRKEISDLCCLRCNECGFISNRKDFLVYHILDIHGLVEFGWHEICEAVTSDEQIEPPKKDTSGKKVKWSFGLCHICGNTYNNILNHLRMHQRHDPTEIVANANKALAKPLSKEHEALLDAIESLPLCDRVLKKPKRPRWNRHPNRRFLCHICGKILKRRLCEHVRIHNPQMHRCNICEKEFNRYSNLLTHMRVHTREKPFQCDICKMTFGYKCSIKGHIINVHSETVR